MTLRRGAKRSSIAAAIVSIGILCASIPARAESDIATPAALPDVDRNRPIAAFFSRLFNRPQLLTTPIAEAILTSGFGMRFNPVLGAWVLHAGVDLSAPRGSPILAAGDGVVISAEWESGYGYTTRILHADGLETMYAHQSRIADGIVPGANIRQGQIIGLVGTTGNATGPHLHYEIHVDGEPVDPLGTDLQPAGLVDG